MRALVGALVLFTAAACSAVPDLSRPVIDSADPRFAGCAGNLGDGVVAAFRLDHHGAWREHFPAVAVPGDVSETNSFAVVFRTAWPGVVLGGDPRDPDPGHADVCVWNGDAESARQFLASKATNTDVVLSNLDMTGFRP